MPKRDVSFVYSKRDNSLFTPAEKEILRLSIKAVNQRIRDYEKRHNVKLNVPQIPLVSTMKKVESMTVGEFKNEYGSRLLDLYEPQKKSQKQLEAEYRREVGDIRYKNYAGESYKEFRTAVREAQKAGIKEFDIRDEVRQPDSDIVSFTSEKVKVDLETLLERANYSPHELEKMAGYLNYLVQGKDTEAKIRESKEHENERKMRELKLNITKFYNIYASNNNIDEDERRATLDSFESMTDDELREMYKYIAKDEYTKTKSPFHWPGYYDVNTDVTEKDILSFQNTQAYRNKIFTELAETSTYIDNYYQAITNSQDITHKDELMQLLRYIDNDDLERVLLMDDLQLDMWYKDKNEDKSREKKILEKLSQLAGLDKSKNTPKKDYIVFKSKNSQGRFNTLITKLLNE